MLLSMILLGGGSQSDASSAAGCARHAGRWSVAPQHTPTTAQVSVADAPLAGNGILGTVGPAPHRESWPSSQPNATALGKQTLWIGSNSFWSANTYGADDAGAAYVLPSGGPFPHCEVPYGMLAVGGLTVDFASGPRVGEDGSYSATQELCGASVSSTVSGTGTGAKAFTMSAIVAADDNVIVANLSCTAPTVATAELWVHKGKADEPFDQPTCGPDNMPRGGAYLLPTSAKDVAGGALVTRSSAADGVNSAVLSPCGPYLLRSPINVSHNPSTHHCCWVCLCRTYWAEQVHQRCHTERHAQGW